MTRRARLFLTSSAVLTLALLIVTTTSAPAAGFPGRTLYDQKLVAPGAGPIAAGDVNGDGLADIVAVDDGTGSFMAFLQGQAGLPATASFAFQGPAARQVVLTDMNGDRLMDVVGLGPNSTTIFHQTDFGFVLGAEIPTPGALDFAVGDVNGDGAIDLAVLSSTQVQIWFQNSTRGAWSMGADVNLTDTAGFHDLAITDLVGDGRPDLVLAKPFEIRVYPQGPLGGWEFTSVSRGLADSFGGHVSLQIKNIDGDGRPDAVVTKVDPVAGYGEVSVYREDGAAFNTSVPFSRITGPLAGWVGVGDLNDDGVTDLAAVHYDPTTTANSIAVHIQRFPGGFDVTPAFRLAVDAPGRPTGIAVGRFGGRPFSDIVIRTPGFLLAYNQEDRPPVLLRAIPSDFSFNVGASGIGLIDLRNYFADDHGVLMFQVVFQERPDLLRASVAPDGHRLDFVAAPGWFGRASFQVAASDGIAGHPKVLSNAFSVMVNALPVFASTPPAGAHAGETFRYQVSVEDPYPVGDTHTFSLVAAPNGMTVDPLTGLVEWNPTEANEGVHAVRIRVQDAHGGAAEQGFELRVVVVPPPPPTGAVVAATTLGAIAALGLGALASENVKYGLLMLFIPLYSKIKREQVLDHFVRGQIYGYVMANPGEHYNAIKAALNLTNGSLAHHLKTLEREHFVKSKRFGLYRRFYPMNMRIPEDGFFAPNEIQRTVVDLIRANPGITQKGIAERLGLTPPTVNYHVGILSDHGAIRVERAGRKTHCFVVENGASPPPAVPGGPAP